MDDKAKAWQAGHRRRMERIYARRGRRRSNIEARQHYIEITKKSQAGVKYIHYQKVLQMAVPV